MPTPEEFEKEFIATVSFHVKENGKTKTFLKTIYYDDGSVCDQDIISIARHKLLMDLPNYQIIGEGRISLKKRKSDFE